MKKWIGKGINSEIKESVSNNVLNIIRALIEDENSTVYIPNAYKCGSSYVQSGDPAVHFFPSDSGKRIAITGIQSNQERYNFSMIGLAPVLVEYPNEDGTVSLKEKKVWRQYNIIRDGELCMDYICATLSKESFEALRNIDILYYNGVIVPKNHEYKAEYVYKILLKDLPLVSTAWAQPDNIGLYQYMFEEADLSARIKALKAIKKNLNESQIIQGDPTGEDKDIYVEKCGPGTERVSEPKQVDCLVYSIKEIPEISYSEEDIYRIYGDNPVILQVTLKNLNKQLKYIRFISRCIVFAIESTTKKGSYDWSELANVPRSKTKFFQEATIDVDGKSCTLVKTVYKKTI